MWIVSGANALRDEPRISGCCLRGGKDSTKSDCF